MHREEEVTAERRKTSTGEWGAGVGTSLLPKIPLDFRRLKSRRYDIINKVFYSQF